LNTFLIHDKTIVFHMETHHNLNEEICKRGEEREGETNKKKEKERRVEIMAHIHHFRTIPYG